MMKVLLAAAEAAPFIITEGFGKTVGELAKELKRKGTDARVILPKYQVIQTPAGASVEKLQELIIPVGWRRQACTVERTDQDGVIYYLVGNDYYFNRPAVYGYEDDGERYAFFCRAVLEAITGIDFLPHIIHGHDWQTGMISVFWDAWYRSRPEYQNIKTVFTVHNAKHQGVFPREFMDDVLGLDWSYFHFDGVECDGFVNFLKGGLNFANKLTLTSPECVKEVQAPECGSHMDGVWRKRAENVCGIIGGIDYNTYNPVRDNSLFVSYDSRALKKKTAAK